MAVSGTSSSSSSTPRRSKPPPKAPARTPPKSSSTAQAKSTETKATQKPAQSRQVETQRIEEQKATERVQVDSRVQNETRQRALAAEDQKRVQTESSTKVAGANAPQKGLAPKTTEPTATTPDPKATNDALRSTDPATREKAMQEVSARAAEGDREAIDQLQGVFGEGMWDQGANPKDGLDHNARGDMRKQALSGLEGAKDHLTKEDYAKIGEQVHSELGDRTARFLGKETAAGKEGAADALRAAATKPTVVDSYNKRAAEELAKSLPPEQVTAADYKTFAKNGEGRGDTHKALVEGVKNDRTGALDAVRGQLHSESKSEQGKAARVLGDAGTTKLDDKDVGKLKELASAEIGRYDFSEKMAKQNAFEALGNAGTGEPPNKAAFDAMRDIQSKIPAAKPGQSSFDDPNSEMRRISGELTQKAWNNDALKSEVATDVVRGNYGAKDSTEAAEMLRDRAMSGDAAAIGALSDRTTRGVRDPAGNKASEILKAASDNGQADKTTDALLKSAQATEGGSHRGNTMEALGHAASNLEGGDPRLDDVRRTLRAGAGQNPARSRQQATDTNEGAARGMQKLGADKLQAEDLKALADKPTKAGDDALKEIAPKVSSETARPALDSLLSRAEADTFATSKRAPSGMDALKSFAGHMNGSDVDRLGKLNDKSTVYGGTRETKQQVDTREQAYADSINDTLGEVLTQNKSPEVQKKAAEAMLLSRKEHTPAQRDKLVNAAVASGDVKLKSDVLKTLPTGPLSDRALSGVADNYTRRLSSALRNSKEGTQMHKLKQLYEAQSIAGTEKFKDNVNVDKINKEIANISGKEPLKGQLEKIRTASIADEVGPNPVQQQQDYILSDTFQQRMKLEGRETATNSVKQELGKLGLMDAKKMEETKDKLTKKTVEENAFKMFQSQDKAQTEQAVNAGLTALMQTPGISKKTLGLLKSMDAAEQAEVAKHINNALHDVNANSLEGASEGLLKAMNAGRRGEQGLQNSAKAKAFAIVDELTKNGRLGTAVSAFGLASIAANGMPQSTKEWISTTGSALSAMGNATDVGKLFNAGNLRKFGDGFENFNKLTKAGQVMKLMDFAGPVADVIGAGLDVHNMVQEYQKGDKVGTATSFVSAGAGIASAAAGLALIAGATGPAAPAVLVGGAIIGLGAWGVNAIWGESDQESFLRRGYKDANNDAVDFWID